MTLVLLDQEEKRQSSYRHISTSLSQIIIILSDPNYVLASDGRSSV